MQALTFERFGEPVDVLTLQERAEPALEPGMVKVRMLASPINPSDLMTIRGIYGKKPTLPAVPGYEGVGIVEQANAGIYGTYLTGKRVAVLNSISGNWQQVVTVPARNVIPLSPQLTLEQAAVFFINPATAWLMTRQVLKIPRDAWLLQSAAGSNVGRMVIGLARQHGFRTINIVRRQSQVAELKALGADAVVVFDDNLSSPQSLQDEVRTLTNGNGVAYAIDPVGGRTGSAMVDSLAAGGQMLVYGTLSNEPLQFSSRSLMTSGSRLEGFWLSHHMTQLGLWAKLKLVGEITRGILSGTLQGEIGTLYPMAQFREAVSAAEQPGKAGKVLLQLNH